MSEAIVQAQTQSQSLFNSSEDAMSKKIRLQDLSISNFDQMLKVDGVKGGFCSSWYGSARFPFNLSNIRCVYDPETGSWGGSSGMLRRR